MLRIAIVDDSDLIRERLLRAISGLAEVGDIQEARTVREAEALVLMRNLDIVLLDLRLPDGSGLALLERLMRQERPPKVIVLTNFAIPQYRERCLNLGAFRFLDKSSEFDQIPAIVAGIADTLWAPAAAVPAVRTPDRPPFGRSGGAAKAGG